MVRSVQIVYMRITHHVYNTPLVSYHITFGIRQNMKVIQWLDANVPELNDNEKVKQ